MTYDTQNGTIYAKIVNVSETPYPVNIRVSGVDDISATGTLIQMKGLGLDEVNTIDNPGNILPVTTDLNGLSKDFTQTFPAYSISVLKMYKQ